MVYIRFDHSPLRTTSDPINSSFARAYESDACVFGEYERVVRHDVPMSDMPR